MGGRETLIKAVLQAIPSYAMSCFKIPVSICSSIEKIMANFWWSNSNDKKGIHWARWDKLCKPKSSGGMGFRDLSAFNQALLAKKVWRIIQNPNSLLSKLFKGRHFKDVDIMEAGLGNNPSFCWRSLLWGREVMAKGLCWRVGDGQSIMVHKDPWIPGLPNFRIKVDSHSSIQRKVVHYIKSTDHIWDERAIREDFSPLEAEAILDINLARSGCVDSRFWVNNKDGIYSVKSGYHVASKSGIPPEFQSQHNYTNWWKVLWKLQIPPKVCIFLWRASWNFIPSAWNMLKRHIPTIGICNLCQTGMANTNHVLFFCPKIRQNWKASPFWKHVKSMRAAPFVDIIINLLQSFQSNDIEEFVMSCWEIWKKYCINLHSEGNKQVEISRIGIHEWLKISRSVAADFEPTGTKFNNSVQTWEPPALGCWRLDVDAGFDEVGKKYSVGAVIRNARGVVKVAAAWIIHCPGSVVSGELLALKNGLELALKCGLENVFAYSDSSDVVQAINRKQEDLSSKGLIIADILGLMDLGAAISVSHMRRVANNVAHCIAKRANSLNTSFEFCADDIPSWIVEVVTKDLLI